MPGPAEVTKPVEVVKSLQEKPKPTFGKKKLNKAAKKAKASEMRSRTTWRAAVVMNPTISA